MNILELSEQEIVRRQSLQTLRDMGIDPYPAAEFPTNAFSTDIRSEFKDEDEPRQVMIAGRLMGRRVMGKASFAEIQDSKGRIQVYVSRDEICHGDNKDLYNVVFKKLMDIGDFIGVKGFVFRTQTGEISVHAQELTLLSKSLKPLPIVKYKDGVAYDQDMYMRIATELYLKRLIVGGFEGVYEIGKNFRNEGMDRNHNPEFTCMELYVQYKDYNWMMAFTEKLLETICIAVNGSPEREIDGKMVSFKAPYRRLPILDAIKEKTGFDCNGKTEEEIRAFCLEKGMEVDETFGKGKLIDELFGEFCEGTFIQPTFITDYPVEMSPLTKMHRSKPGLTERFELMVNGKELANAYSELNDPIDQENRFIDQMKLADKGDDEAMIIDKDFLRALQYGMPPTSGIGIGIDRLVMLMTGKTYIQEVLFFPQMKPEKKMPQSTIKEWEEIGVSENWAYVMRKAGFNLISDIKGEKAQGLQQKIGEINKKYKLGYEKPSLDEVQNWIDKANPSAEADASTES